MEKLQLSQILNKDSSLSANKLDDSDEKILSFIKHTKQEQEKLLKLKNIDEDSLKMVVQL